MLVCPKCGKSHFQYLYSTRTLLAWTPVYKDGKLVNKDPNTTTNYLKCNECGHKWKTTEEIVEVVDDEVQTK